MILCKTTARNTPSLALRCVQRQFTSSSPAPKASQEETPPLLELRDACLGFPGSVNHLTSSIDLTIHPPLLGGHALLGRNGTGKSLLGQTIVLEGDPEYLKKGDFVVHDSRWHSRAIAHVSFNSHKELVREGGSTYKAIAEGGSLSKAAQFLVVRFGLYPLLRRDVETLSTGEMRKVLLVRALANRPKLLILDNAFDGLDVASREILKELVQKTISGFTQDILVQGVNSSATAHTQILMMTHRPEELVDEIEVISWLGLDRRLRTERRQGRSGVELMRLASEKEDDIHLQIEKSFNWECDSLPSVPTVKSWWGRNREEGHHLDKVSDSSLVHACDLSINRGDVTLLRNLHWTIKEGQRWLIGGGNGAGKSTLSRLLANHDPSCSEALQVLPGTRVGWVSTESHLQFAVSNDLAKDVLMAQATSFEEAEAVADWLDLKHYLVKPFKDLSQGQQKLVLVAAALASRPNLLVLDEPCQGLDMIHRQRLLTVVDRICQATNMSLVYITHHFEELLPSVTHALHLQDRRAVYNGLIGEYSPNDL